MDVLGVTDFGIYNVVGGVVILFSFLNNSMSSATQRFLNFELGRNDLKKLNQVFNNAFLIHFLIGIFIVAIAALLGRYIITEFLVIPDDRIDAALIIYYTSILLFFIKIIQVPYNAIIIAHEKMNFYAYISIAEGLLTLLMVFLLKEIAGDKLVIYGVALMLIAIIVFIIYFVFTFRKYKETHLKLDFNKNLMIEMITFSGWSMFGNLSFVAKTQGVNMLLNVFFNPAINAARAIAVQLQAAVQSFVLNFQTAVRPQIVKSYAQQEHNEMMKLVFLSSKYSFILLLILSLPLMFEINYVLNLWLKDVPNFTALFTIIILIEILIDSFSNPLLIAIQATGKVRKYQIIIGGILLFNLPISYIALSLGYPAYSVFIVSIFITILASIARVSLLQNLIQLNLKEYTHNIIIKSLLIGIIVSLSLWLFTHFMPSGFYRLIMTILLSTILIVIGTGLTMSIQEKNFVKSKLVLVLNRIK